MRRMLEASSDGAEVVKVALKKYESARTPKQRVIVTPNSFMQKKSRPQYLQGGEISCRLHETTYDMSCRFPCYDYLPIIANV